MKWLIYIIITSLSAVNGNASTLILEEIQKSIIADYKLEGKIKIVDNTPLEPTLKPKIELKKGEQIIQEQLKQNRERIKQLRQQDINDDKAPINNSLASKQEEINNWQAKKKQEIHDWQNEKQLQINQWMTEHKKFIKRIPEYKQNLISEKDFKDDQIQSQAPKNNTQNSIKLISQKITMPIFPDYFIIDKALDVDIKDQGKRPTCAAFTGIRAIEILMSQQGKNEKLSEQYFFWSSIPTCQSSPCKKKGSWVYNGYQSSLDSKFPNIPLEKDCPYNRAPLNDNVTQIPLSDGCLSGFTKIKKFNSVESNAEIITAIKNGQPVIGGFKLSENFYQNNGYVFEQSIKNDSAKLDEHAEGHAILLVGIMKLPPELHPAEGTFCLISANSWGTGWGKGGHACLSEKWINKHRFDVPFIALEKIETI